MNQSLKVTTFPQNPQLIVQIEQFLQDSNNLIRDGYYRKCIMHLDSQYKKLLSIDSPLLLKIKVLRRLCYCTVMYFKLKINKGEINQGRNQFVLWSRLQLYIRDLHDNLSLLRIQFKKKYYMKELIFIIVKAFLFKTFYYQKIQLVARGLLSMHHQIGLLFQQTLVEKLSIFHSLQGKYNLIAGNSYFQLQNFAQAEQLYLKALDLFQKNLEIVYKELTMTSLEQIKLTLKFYTREIILTLFLLTLVYEQTNDFIKYQETIKIMVWMDQNYQPENSFCKIYLMNYIDVTKYVEFALETTEIVKALKSALPEPEIIKTTKEEDQLLYYTNMLYEFDEYPKIKRQYYYYDKSYQPQYQTEANESEIIYDKSRTLKTNASAQFVFKTQQNDNESTSIGKSALMKTKLSENGLSTRFQTETEGLSQPSLTNLSQRKLKKKFNKEDMTLQIFYANAIEKSVKLQDIDILTQKHNEDLQIEQEETFNFDKSLTQSKQKIQFKKLFGSIGKNHENFQYSTRESRQKQRKLCSKSINQLQQLLTIQITLKTKTESNKLLNDYNKQRKKIVYSTPDIFSKLQNQNQSLKKLEIEQKNINQTSNANTQRKEQDEEKIYNEIKISTKDTIKSLMDEKEQLISKPIQHIPASHCNQSRNNMISERLIKQNDQLAFTTDLLSHSKKVNSLKTLLDIPRNNPSQKRMTLTNITPRPQQKMGSHTNLPFC